MSTCAFCFSLLPIAHCLSLLQTVSLQHLHYLAQFLFIRDIPGSGIENGGVAECNRIGGQHSGGGMKFGSPRFIDQGFNIAGTDPGARHNGNAAISQLDQAGKQLHSFGGR